MDVLKLLDLLEEVIEDGSMIPFSSKVCLGKQELLDFTREIRISIPDEIKQAEWIKEERQRILAEAHNESENITNEAKLHIEELIETDEITREAKERAEEIISGAKKNAKEIRLGAREYADQMLKEVQEKLRDMINTLDINREELKGI